MANHQSTTVNSPAEKSPINSNPKSFKIPNQNFQFHIHLLRFLFDQSKPDSIFFHLKRLISNGVSSSIVSGQAIAEEEFGKYIRRAERSCRRLRRRVPEEAICDSDFVFESSFVPAASQSSGGRVRIRSSGGRFDDSLWRRGVYRSHF